MVSAKPKNEQQQTQNLHCIKSSGEQQARERADERAENQGDDHNHTRQALTVAHPAAGTAAAIVRLPLGSPRPPVRARRWWPPLPPDARAVRVIRTPARAPNANAFAERWIRSVREECLAKLLILGEHHLDRVLAAYVDYYNHARPHQGIDQECPVPLVGRAARDGSIARRGDRAGSHSSG